MYRESRGVMNFCSELRCWSGCASMVNKTGRSTTGIFIRSLACGGIPQHFQCRSFMCWHITIPYKFGLIFMGMKQNKFEKKIKMAEWKKKKNFCQSVSYKFVKQFQLNLPYPNGRKFSRTKGKTFLHFQLDVWYFYFSHNRRNGFWTEW